jgi:hypothetical protein
MEYQAIVHKNNGGDMSDQKAYSFKSQVPEMFIGMITIGFSYGILFLSALVYKDSSLSQGWSAWLMALIVSAILGLFFFFYGCKEPDYFRDDSARHRSAHLKSKRLFGNIGGLFEYFFDNNALMLQTLGVNLYEAVRLVDYVFMLVMLQTHPFYKGHHIGRMRLITWSLIACIIGFAVVEVLLTGIIQPKNAGKWMRITAISSIFAYPLLNSLIAALGYHHPGWTVFGYIIAEIGKFFLLFIMREGLHETINKSKKKSSREKFRALGLYSENFFKFLCFLIFGSIICWFMRSNRIQKMNPFNYTFSFLILCIPLVGTWVLLLLGKTKEQDTYEKEQEREA